MKLRPFIVQPDRDRPLPAALSLSEIDRFDIQSLLNSLKFPIIWCYDHYLQSWLPGEVSHDLLAWLSAGANDLLSRKDELLRAGLLDPVGRLWWEDLNATRVKAGVVKLPKLLAPEYARWMAEHYHREPKHDRWPDMAGISRTSLNDMPLVRLLHVQLTSLVSYVINQGSERLKPSYSFTAAYDETSNLPAHRDRPQCVFNISLVLDGKPAGTPLSIWPLHVDVDGTENLLGLEAGDGALYRGTADLHWRDKMAPPLVEVTGTFLHYVPADFAGSLA